MIYFIYEYKIKRNKKGKDKKTAVFKPFEEAKEAVFKLNFLKQYLTPQDEETEPRPIQETATNSVFNL